MHYYCILFMQGNTNIVFNFFIEYLQELCEVLMYIVLPPEDFQNLVSRLILRVSIFSAFVYSYLLCINFYFITLYLILYF